jgi:hypothetical protein
LSFYYCDVAAGSETAGKLPTGTATAFVQLRTTTLKGKGTQSHDLDILSAEDTLQDGWCVIRLAFSLQMSLGLPYQNMDMTVPPLHYLLKSEEGPPILSGHMRPDT